LLNEHLHGAIRDVVRGAGVLLWQHHTQSDVT
jgi:hypothetical protein